MRKMLFLLTIIVILPCFSLVSRAEEGVDKYISEFKNAVPDGTFDGEIDGETIERELGFGTLLSEIFEIVSGEGSGVGAFFATLLGSLVLLGIASTVSGELAEAVSAAVGAVVSVLIFSSVYRIYSSVSEAVRDANDFFVALIPVTVGITSLSGGNYTAGVQATGMSVCAAVISKLWGAAFTSVSGIGLAMSLISSYGGGGTDTVSRWVKNLFSRFLGIVTVMISGTLSLQTMVASARDCAAMRAAKYAASGMIPVVGSTVASALSTLASGVSYVKGIVGGGTVLVLVSIMLSPLVLILMYRFALSLAKFASEFFDIGGGVKIFSAYLYSLDTVLATYALSCLVYLFEIILFVKGGVGS